MRQTIKVLAVGACVSLAAGYAEASTATFGYTGSEQIFTAPFTGQYDIIAIGAKGGDAYNSVPGVFGATNSGGAGAFIEGTFNLNFGDQLEIYTGGVGANGAYNLAGTRFAYGAGGGGGTFIAYNHIGYIEVAGGGGGAGIGGIGEGGEFYPDAFYGYGTYGGSNGNGGSAGKPESLYDPSAPGLSVDYGGGGGGSGVISSGQDGALGGGQGGQGLVGGLGANGSGAGGYGGGGGGDAFGDGGGGGGYSGGGGGSHTPTNFYIEPDGSRYYTSYTGQGGGGGGTKLIGGNLVKILLGIGQGAGYAQITYTEPSGGSGFSGPPHIPGVPEPATWATMLLGIGVAGAGLRRRRVHRDPKPGDAVRA